MAYFTGHRGGVYFESRFALGDDIREFCPCRQNDMHVLLFDLRQFNCVAWETAENLEKRLAVRLEAVLGRGPNKS